MRRMAGSSSGWVLGHFSCNERVIWKTCQETGNGKQNTGGPGAVGETKWGSEVTKRRGGQYLSTQQPCALQLKATGAGGSRSLV